MTLVLLKKMIAELTSKQDFKTLNTLFRRNLNASMFYTKTLNEDTPQSNKKFSKRNCKLCKLNKFTKKLRIGKDFYCPVVMGNNRC